MKFGSLKWKLPPLRTMLLITITTVALIEIVLHVAEPRILREDRFERSLTYIYDAELG